MKTILLLSTILGGCVALQPSLFIDSRDRCMAVVRDTGEIVQLPRYQCDKGWYK